jgi:hypothetical protein
MVKFSVKLVKKYQKEQNDLLMEYCNFTEGKMINEGNPFDLIPKDKMSDFTNDMQDLEYKYICIVMDAEYSEDMDFDELADIIKKFKNKYKLDETSFGALVKKFL